MKTIVLIVISLSFILIQYGFAGPGAAAVDASGVRQENFFSSGRYFRFEKGTHVESIRADRIITITYSIKFYGSAEIDFVNEDEGLVLRRSKGGRRGWVKI